MLNASISEEEIHMTISQLATSNKAPGPNGYVTEFYKMMKKEITNPLEALYTQMMRGDRYFPTGSSEAHKQSTQERHRDTEIPSSYHSISLINIDAKIMTNILTNRLSQILPSLIHPAQSGFVKERSPVMIIRKALVAQEFAKQNPTKDTIIFFWTQKKPLITSILTGYSQ